MELRRYSALWRIQGESQCMVIYELLQGLAPDVRHVGSTAIPEMAAKPILDIAVAVAPVVDLGEVRGRLESSGEYAFRRDLRESGGLLFVKGVGDIRTVHIHVVDQFSEWWINCLRFQNYMGRHPERRDAYERLKLDLADQFPEDRLSYTAAKQPFIRETLALARACGD